MNTTRLGGGVCMRIRRLLPDQLVDLLIGERLPMANAPHERPKTCPALIVCVSRHAQLPGLGQPVEQVCQHLLRRSVEALGGGLESLKLLVTQRNRMGHRHVLLARSAWLYSVPLQNTPHTPLRHMLFPRAWQGASWHLLYAPAWGRCARYSVTLSRRSQSGVASCRPAQRSPSHVCGSARRPDLQPGAAPSRDPAWATPLRPPSRPTNSPRSPTPWPGSAPHGTGASGSAGPAPRRAS